MKYLIFIFLSIISFNLFADYRATDSFGYNFIKNGSTALAACQNLATHINQQSGDNLSSVTVNNIYCSAAGGRQFGSVSYVQPKCPSQSEMGGMMNAFFDYNTPVPLKLCTEIEPNKFCVFEATSDNPLITNYPTRQQVTLWSKSTTPASTCTPAYKGVCDKNDPYGGCYTPPNDGCTRQFDGSIVCPPEAQPPQPQPTCGGATYCVRPPEGCGTGYVSGSFNGQQLCVKSGPSNPPEPEPETEPNQCTAQYCPKPEPDKDCSSGYYSTNFNGSAICVADNPNPNQPNINDPNNNQNASSEPSTGDDPNTNFDVKGIIDSIKALRDSLLSALSNLGKKISELVTGQKETNEKLDTANTHLENLEKSSQAASESLGDIKEESKKTNEKLDTIKDSIDSQNKCLNESYDSNNPNSQKYRECTEQELIPQGDDTKVTVQEKTVNLDQELKRDLFGGNSTCPPPLVIEWTFIATATLEFKYDLMCYAAALVRPWMILLGLIVSYFVITGHRSGSQD